MSTRILSLLLALSLLWSAFMAAGLGSRANYAESTVSVASSVLQPAPQAPKTPFGLDSAGPDQHSPVDTALGEQPAQGLLEAAAEPLALLRSLPGTATPPLSMARPRAPAVDTWLAPHLDGPRRPPRPTSLVG